MTSSLVKAAPPSEGFKHPQNGAAVRYLEEPPGVGSTRGEDNLGGAALLVAEVVDVLGGGHCGSGAVTDRRRYLLGELGAHVTDRPDARDGRLHVAVRDQIPR